MEEKRIIEAALFMSSKPLTAMELGKLVGIAAPGFVANIVTELTQEYESRGSAIVIASDEGKYSMKVSGDYIGKVKDFAGQTEISKHALRTLAYIAKFEGMKKSKLANTLGSTIYQDVAELHGKGFISQQKAGRTKALFTTQKFKDYFAAGGVKEAEG
jgi:segregation and condensation protein B